MRKIIYLSILVFLLCTGIGLAESKFELNYNIGSYWPSFPNHPQTQRVFNLNQTIIQGCSLSYGITPEFSVRLQVDSFKMEKLSPTGAPVSLVIEATSVSILGLTDLFTYKNYSIYGGIGLVDRSVRTRCSGWGNLPYYTYGFGFPWGITVAIGMKTSYKILQVSIEAQYTSGVDGELYDIPLDWDGFKFLIGAGMKF